MSTLPATSSVPSAAPTDSPLPASCWQKDFLRMLPKIEQHARIVFRDRNREARAEAVQEAVCNACVAFACLAEQDRTHVATWSSLANYAVAQVRAGRRVGTSLNVHDVSSQHCQQWKSVNVQSLHRWDDQNEDWTEMVVEDRHSTPADLATFRIDFRDFLRSLSRRDRKLALMLARGHATKWIAQQFKISAGRVSQLRRELCEAWQRFQGELVLA